VEEVSAKYLRCETNHLTPFAAGLFVPPNAIEFDYVFANASFENNLSIYVALCVILITYALLTLFAMYKDRQDMLTLRSLPMTDNESTVCY
jgi:hypothetical protein